MSLNHPQGFNTMKNEFLSMLDVTDVDRSINEALHAAFSQAHNSKTMPPKLDAHFTFSVEGFNKLRGLSANISHELQSKNYDTVLGYKYAVSTKQTYDMKIKVL